MWRSAPLGIRVRKAESSSGLCFAVSKARMARCSRGVAAGADVFVADWEEGWVAGRGAVCASARAVKLSRRDADAESRVRQSMGVLAVWAMRKDSARGMSWRYGVGLLYLGCVCVAGSLPAAGSPEKAGATDGNRRAVVLGDPRQQALCQGHIAQL